MISIIIVAIFFIGTAFFSGTEIGLISLNKYKLKHKAEKSKQSKHLLNFVSNPDKVLGTTLIGTNISMVIVSSVFTAYVVGKGILPKITATLILTAFLLIFAEIIPKIYFQNRAEYTIPKLFFIIKFFSLIFTPFIWIFGKINSLFLKIFKFSQENNRKLFSKEDLSLLLSEAKKNGEVNKDEHDLIEEVLDFREFTVKNIMVPRTNIVAIKFGTTLKDVIEISRKKGFTRFPIFSSDIDHIEGILIIHDLLKISDLTKPAEEFMRDPYFVSEVMKATTLLKKMQEKKTSLSIVVDEYGGTAGLISVEDLLEELVGKIEDEYDEVEQDIHKINENTFIVNGDVEIEQLIEDYNIDLEEGEYETIAGYLISKLERIPKHNEKISVKNYEFLVKKVSTKKIEKIIIKISPQKSKSEREN
ncbi:MAG: HlyC/CorC family transporter [Candidatus Cloacimonetes bacterium]|nr:HlyC/CorC family transporter [Candidatus Cloacimonadota bacterium]